MQYKWKGGPGVSNNNSNKYVYGFDICNQLFQLADGKLGHKAAEWLLPWSKTRVWQNKKWN